MLLIPPDENKTLPLPCESDQRAALTLGVQSEAATKQVYRRETSSWKRTEKSQ